MVASFGHQSAAVIPLYGRKLIAVVYADMAGYSRLIGLDDEGTFERLQELRRDLIDPALIRHGGTLVNTAGDSLLVIFDSIISAMRFAVDAQRGVPDFDGDYAPDRRIRFRMGVNVGDVIPDGKPAWGGRQRRRPAAVDLSTGCHLRLPRRARSRWQPARSRLQGAGCN